MYSVYLNKKTEQSDSNLHHSIFLVRCSAVRFKCSFVRALPLAKKTAGLINVRNFVDITT
ncbi:hypothetical protein D1AOALGA4SA_9501 [Olavius algarvensis Delta 1 endosymbiont]|nr:hypothetical protein D1AOALGA4SA_9501 [Olavius algarvensis Delta 1 endosymbiont]